MDACPWMVLVCLVFMVGTDNYLIVDAEAGEEELLILGAHLQPVEPDYAFHGAGVKPRLRLCRRLFKSGIVVGAKVEALRENRKLGFQASGSLEVGVGEE